MRIVVPVGALIALMLVGVQPSAAATYEGPWCAKVAIGDGDFADRCDMRSFEMCLAEIRGMGASHCAPNPYYRGAVEEPRPRKPRPARQ